MSVEMTVRFAGSSPTIRILVADGMTIFAT
jgi:hypothetical protein